MVNRCDSFKIDIKRQDSLTNEDYDNEDDFDEEGQCYDCVEPDVVEDSVVQNSPNFGSINVVDSTNVHFGHKTYYQGPVTVLKQTIVAPSEVGQIKSDLANGLPPTKEGTNINAATKVRLALCSGSKKRQLVVTSVGVFVILILISVYLSLLIGQIKITSGNEKTPSTTNLGDTGDGTVLDVFPASESSATFLEGKTLRIRERSEWLAQPPVAEMAVLKTPAPYVIITHSASEGCHTTADCIARVRTIQQLHIESRGWSDIGYNFLVGGDGAVYMGRGWNTVGAISLGWNDRSIGICIVGTFTTIEPTEKQLFTTQKLIARGVVLGKIAANYKLLAHNQTQSTESPGRLLYNKMKDWPHWYNSTEPLTSEQLSLSMK